MTGTHQNVLLFEIKKNKGDVERCMMMTTAMVAALIDLYKKNAWQFMLIKRPDSLFFPLNCFLVVLFRI